MTINVRRRDRLDDFTEFGRLQIRLRYRSLLATKPWTTARRNIRELIDRSRKHPEVLLEIDEFQHQYDTDALEPCIACGAEWGESDDPRFEGVNHVCQHNDGCRYIAWWNALDHYAAINF